jgi:Phytanoyl-CoA dioxygenase (PhyH)
MPPLSRTAMSLHDPTAGLDAAVRHYQEDGVVLLPRFLETSASIAPLWQQIRSVIDICRAECGLPPSDGEEFDSGLPELVAEHRAVVGKVYDAVRKLPAYYMLASSERVLELVGRLMDTDLPGWYSQGSGIRMDHPGEDQFLSPWHQEYPSHLNSLDLLTLWIPLVPVDEVVGSVIFCPRSHSTGLLPVYLDDPLNANRNGSKATEIANLDRYVAEYPETSVDTTPGDIVALHGLTLHRSRPNASMRTRWSIQLRYFNFRDEQGRRMFWTGGMLAGVDLQDVHPEAVIARPDA